MHPPPSLTLSFICLLSFTWIHFFVAQDSPQDFLDAHNAARLDAGVRNLSWDEGVAAFAELFTTQHRNDCKLVHSLMGPYGENLAWGTGDMSAAVAVGLWVGEKQDYNSTTNLCAEGRVCGQYTQVIWWNTEKLGCFKVRCSDGGTLISCNYDPKGNIMGENPKGLRIDPVCAPKRLVIKNHMPLPL